MSKLDAASALGKPVHRDVEQPGQLLASLDVRLADVRQLVGGHPHKPLDTIFTILGTLRLNLRPPPGVGSTSLGDTSKPVLTLAW